MKRKLKPSSNFYLWVSRLTNQAKQCNCCRKQRGAKKNCKGTVGFFKVIHRVTICRCKEDTRSMNGEIKKCLFLGFYKSASTKKEDGWSPYSYSTYDQNWQCYIWDPWFKNIKQWSVVYYKKRLYISRKLTHNYATCYSHTNSVMVQNTLPEAFEYSHLFGQCCSVWRVLCWLPLVV